MYGLVKKKLALPLGKTFLSEPLSLDGFSLSDSNLQWVGRHSISAREEHIQTFSTPLLH